LNAKPSTGRAKAKPKTKKCDTKILNDFHDSDFPSSEESEDGRAGGIKLHPLLLKISRPYQVTPEERERKKYGSGSMKRFRCIGSKGCKTSWKQPRDRQRIFKHAKGCNYIPANLRREVIELMAEKAAGPKLQINRTKEYVDTEDEVEKASAPKKAKQNHPNATLQVTHGSLDCFVREGKKNLQNAGDHALLLFITCTGIPPTIVNSCEFKNLVSALNTDYCPPSETTLSDKLIPNEAAKIQQTTIKYLRTCRDLTITFDGGKMRSSNGLYSVHVTTAERRSFCLTLDDASRLSHTGEYIAELLDGVSDNELEFEPDTTHS
jgi:hypothetical protein